MGAIEEATYCPDGMDEIMRRKEGSSVIIVVGVVILPKIPSVRPGKKRAPNVLSQGSLQI